ncbi:MAG: serine/threonine protein kinase, partial [Lentisphaerales bacterium]|nr:serine/threonine protein kinase [Lentisphaerales bacterium]
EYLEGGSLEDEMSDQPMAPEKVLQIALDIAAALYETERLGIVHRDIKPENILLSKDGYKLTDLGLARHQQVEYEDGLTLSQAALGTPHYISPEQVLDARGVDIRSDIYSLGATLYNCLTAERVHEGANNMPIMMKQINAPLANPMELTPQTPAGLSLAVMKMLEKEPDNRFQSSYELIEALKSISAEGGDLADPQELKPKNLAGMSMFIAFVFLVIFASGAFIRMACLPPIENDPYYQKARAKFTQLPVINSQTLLGRAEEIENYLNDYPRDKDISRISRAGHLARQFSRMNDYRLTVKKVGVFSEARKFELRIGVGDQKFKVEAKQKKTVVYPDEKFKFMWDVDQVVSLEVEEFDWLSEIVFKQEYESHYGLMQLSGERYYKLPKKYKNYFKEGQLTLAFELEGVSADDWQIFADYIYPGDKW